MRRSSVHFIVFFVYADGTCVNVHQRIYYTYAHMNIHVHAHNAHVHITVLQRSYYNTNTIFSHSQKDQWMSQLRQQSKRKAIRKISSPTYSPRSARSHTDSGQNGQHEEDTADADEQTTDMEEDEEDVPIPSHMRPPIDDDLVSPEIAEYVFSPQDRSAKSACDSNSPLLFGLWGLELGLGVGVRVRVRGFDRLGFCLSVVIDRVTTSGIRAVGAVGGIGGIGDGSDGGGGGVIVSDDGENWIRHF